MIYTHQACCSHSLLATIIGAAKNWNSRYKRSLRNAIDFNNNGIAINSPISSQYLITEVEAGSSFQRMNIVVLYC